MDKYIMKNMGMAAICVAVLAGFSAPVALAHGGHDLRLKVSVSMTELRLETSVPAQLFLKFDSNDDGVLSLVEAKAQRSEINAWLDSKVVLQDVEGKVFKAQFSDAPIINELEMKAGDPVEFFKILRRYKLGDAPKGVRLDMQVYDHDPIVLFSRAGLMGKFFPVEICAGSPSSQLSPERDHAHDHENAHSHEDAHTHNAASHNHHDDEHDENHAPLCYKG